jgi:hypothetical protein
MHAGKCGEPPFGQQQRRLLRLQIDPGAGSPRRCSLTGGSTSPSAIRSCAIPIDPGDAPPTSA